MYSKCPLQLHGLMKTFKIQMETRGILAEAELPEDNCACKFLLSLIYINWNKNILTTEGVLSLMSVPENVDVCVCCGGSLSIITIYTILVCL